MTGWVGWAIWVLKRFGPSARRHPERKRTFLQLGECALSCRMSDTSKQNDPTLDAGAESEDQQAGVENRDAENCKEMTEFGPVPVRYRHDGWVPDRQLAFIERLADCGCVSEAAKSVGMSRAAAYALRRRSDAQAFRLAWDAAMDTAVARLGDAALSRAINGVPVPIFQRGEQVGERRHFDERLTMFLLRYRDPSRYGKWIDRACGESHPDGPALQLAYRTGRMLRAGWKMFNAALRGEAAPEPEPEVFAQAPEEAGKPGRV